MVKFDSLDSLDSTKYEWNIKVRVIRLWDSYSTKGEKEFKGRNMLLLDDKHTRMHAFIWPNYLEQFKNSFEEGKIYAIRNFAVKNYRKDSLRCTKSDNQIWLSNYTKVFPLDVDEKSDRMIRQNEFDFFDLGEIPELMKQEDNNHLIDFIGVLKDKDFLRQYTNHKEVEQRSFRFALTDGSSSVKLCFWDELAVLFDNALSQGHHTPIVIIVASCKLNEYKGEPYVSNVAATRFYINIDHRSVVLTRQRYNLSSLDNEQAIVTHTEEIEIMSLNAIRNLDTSFILRKVMCQVIVRNVKDKLDWNYTVCTSCHTEVELVDKKYKCQKCNRSVPFPDMRFRICLLVEDSSGGAIVILDDREVYKIIGKTVDDVVAEQERENTTTEFPKILKMFEGNAYTITLLLNGDNINRGSHTYIAVDIYEGFDAVENAPADHDDSNGTFKISQNSATYSTSQSMANDSFKTPDTEKSSNANKIKKLNNNSVITITNLDECDDGFEEKENGAKRKAPLKEIKKEKK